MDQTPATSDNEPITSSVSPSLRDAQECGLLRDGTYQLLARLRCDLQEQVLKQLLQMPSPPPTEVVHDAILLRSADLAHAGFDSLTQCGGCRYNTASHPDHFTGDARCLNAPCFSSCEAAAEAEVQEIRARVWRNCLRAFFAEHGLLRVEAICWMVASGWSVPAGTSMSDPEQCVDQLIAHAPLDGVGRAISKFAVPIERYSAVTPRFVRRMTLKELDQVQPLLDCNAMDAQSARARGRVAYAAFLAAHASEEKLRSHVPLRLCVT